MKELNWLEAQKKTIAKKKTDITCFICVYTYVYTFHYILGTKHLIIINKLYL